MSIIAKFALDQGLSQHVLVAYRHALAFLVISPFATFCNRNPRPKMTFPLLVRIMLLSLIEPVMDQNLYFTGMKLTTAAFTSTLFNVVPAFAFLLAWTLKLEKVDVRRVNSQVKLFGTAVTVGGAMMMTLVKGSVLNLPWTEGVSSEQETQSASDDHNLIYGSLMIATCCVCWTVFVTLQAILLKSYPDELSLAAWICLMGAVEGTVCALVIEWNNPSAWSIHMDCRLLAVVYSGVICSGVAYYVQGLILKAKGPIFLTAFGPLSMIIVTIMGSIVLAEKIYTARVVGAAVIVTGLYMVLWGKGRDTKEAKSASATATNDFNYPESIESAGDVSII
ncbi:WAT1-related protein At2g39510-like [Neltuma alba]|uniref:WAT1-related protein At2g39510-like n=1 Tax=Neltuma alba TaxID=207710 RepID=UPI0010A490D2|nr:WAT1-related protein At2g39510-like [Prosopis alba]